VSKGKQSAHAHSNAAQRVASSAIGDRKFARYATIARIDAALISHAVASVQNFKTSRREEKRGSSVRKANSQLKESKQRSRANDEVSVLATLLAFSIIFNCTHSLV